jgi:hypothetical protein
MEQPGGTNRPTATLLLGTTQRELSHGRSSQHTRKRSNHRLVPDEPLAPPPKINPDRRLLDRCAPIVINQQPQPLGAIRHRQARPIIPARGGLVAIPPAHRRKVTPQGASRGCSTVGAPSTIRRAPTPHEGSNYRNPRPTAAANTTSVPPLTTALTGARGFGTRPGDARITRLSDRGPTPLPAPLTARRRANAPTAPPAAPTAAPRPLRHSRRSAP